MKRNVIFILFCFFIIIFSYVTYFCAEYLYSQKTNQGMLEYCSQNNTEACKKSKFELLLSDLLVYNIHRKNEKIYFSKLTIEPVWLPSFVFNASRAFIFYTDSFDNILKYNFEKYQDAVYGLYGIEIYGYYRDSDNTIKSRPLPYNTYYEKKGSIPDSISIVLEKLKKQNKKVIMHFSIENQDSEFLTEIFNSYSDVISGMTLYIQVSNPKQLSYAKNILKLVNEKYILCSRNSLLSMPRMVTLNDRFIKGELYPIMPILSKYYKGHVYNSTFVLSYINKNMVDKYNIALQQDSAKNFKGEKVKWYRSLINPPQSDIHWAVTVTEIVKQKIKKWTKR